MSTTEEQIIFKLVNCQSEYKLLVKDYKELYDNLVKHEVLDNELLRKEFKNAVFKKFADELARDLSCDAENIYLVLENLNLENYLNA